MDERKALLVIDMQNDYLWDKRKPMFSYDTDKLTGDVNRLIAIYGDRGYDIIYIKHILPKLMWGVGFSIKGTEGAELYGGLNIVSDLSFEKNRSDTYTARAFRDYMKEQNYGATAKGAVKTGVKVVMIENCIGRRFPDAKVQRMREALRALGIKYTTEALC